MLISLSNGWVDNPQPMTLPTLLLLEDDPAIARTVAYALGREGFGVEHVLLVREARARLLAPGSALVAAILDVGLPDGSGLDLCRELRQARPALPLVLLTARDEEMDRVLGLELGADDYITKPFSPRELCARVRALLRRAAVSAPVAVTPSVVTGFEVDPQDGRLRLDGVWLTLTRREQGLLTLLLRAPGRIWAREALLDAVWGQDADSLDRTVDTHIKTLRAKLREVRPHQELIVTHRGLGYALVVPEPRP